MVTHAIRQEMDRQRLDELRTLTPWERKVMLACATFTPPPKVVRARRPYIRKGGLPPFGQ